MKLLALVVVVAATACSINHRTGEFACTTTADCAAGRVCSDGLCVISDSGTTTPDARTPDGGVCPSICTSCDLGTKTCTIDCSLNAATCNAAIACPIGYTCNIACRNANNCRSGISCVGSKGCNITCSGSQSCRDITCGTGFCNIDCAGVGSCRNLSCGLACACDVTCAAGSSCTTVLCKPGCDGQPLGCTSKGTGCNTCIGLTAFGL